MCDGKGLMDLKDTDHCETSGESPKPVGFKFTHTKCELYHMKSIMAST